MSNEARTLLDSVKGKSLSRETRIQKAIQLARCIQNSINQNISKKEEQFLHELSSLVNDAKGKIITFELFDQAFRSKNDKRIADQIHYILNERGVPSYLQGLKKWGFKLLAYTPVLIGQFFVPLINRLIKQDAERVILSSQRSIIANFIIKNNSRKVITNLNRLGEAILGEDEAKERLKQYLVDLSDPLINYISIKISTLYSQIHPLAQENTLKHLKEKYRILLEACLDNKKFINLDMEEFKDLQMTVDLFKSTLSEEKFKNISAGIVLQSYLPESFAIQKELTEFAKNRVENGGAPIKIRLVKGANLAMEKVEASIHGWPLAPFNTKLDVDANFKKMMEFGLDLEHIPYVHIGIASHNLFDISYALILQNEKQLSEFLTFEMLEGMSKTSSEMIQELSGSMLLYCPTVDEKNFHQAVAYLLRRLDENTGPDNFLRASFFLKPETAVWNQQVELFKNAFKAMETLSSVSNRKIVQLEGSSQEFQNEPDTDWSQEANVKWIHGYVQEWSKKNIDPIPIVLKNGLGKMTSQVGMKKDFMNPQKSLYTFSQGTADELNFALDLPGKKISLSDSMITKLVDLLKKRRADLISAMVLDVAKPVAEGDGEVSEAIDFANYYFHQIKEWNSRKEILLEPKGIVVVASPWNFPLSIPAGGIFAALFSGNRVIFKPAPESVLVGYELAKIIWDAGISYEQFQFFPCTDNIAELLVKDARVDAVILTGSTETARHILKSRPGIDLMAETGGKNAMIVTAMADRDLAVKDVVQSAFGYAGQKCSACSLLILEKEVFHDPIFRKQLKDATSSLKTGSAWDFATKIPPLIRPPGEALQRGIQLERQESWLIEPVIDSKNPQLLSPGIKWNVSPGSFTHLQELFGPLLGVLCADDLNHAIVLANQTPYGLTSGLHSLDPREHALWLQGIHAGNCYINRGITGAIVRRQPFGGTKASVFGPAAKSGGPNYILQMCNFKEKNVPLERLPILERLQSIVAFAKSKLTETEFIVFTISCESYSYWWTNYFSKKHDPSALIGEDNLLCYRPFERVELRIQSTDEWIDLLRILIAASVTCTPLIISRDRGVYDSIESIHHTVIQESDDQFIERIAKNNYNRVRIYKEPYFEFKKKLSQIGAWSRPRAVLSFGRVELLNYLRELSVSYDYHRFGNLGARENEQRKPIN